MTLPVLFALIGSLAVALGLVSRPLRNLPVTEPLLALALGVAVGPLGAGLVALDPAVGEQALHRAAELAVAVAVMAVPLRFPPSSLRSEATSLVLLLGLGMAGMGLLSWATAALALGLAPAAAVLLGSAITPTDPVLAANVVQGKPAEAQLPTRVRLLLSVESGANDGLAAPMVALATAGGALAVGVGRAGLALVVSVVVGVVAGGVAGSLLLWSERHRDFEHSAFLALTLALTVAVLGAATVMGGYGILAVFVAGLAYSRQVGRSERVAEWQVQEAINRYLVLPVFVLFGLTIPWQAWTALGWSGIAFAVAALTLRRVPVLLALGPLLRLRPAESVFVGWFGPVGVAALLYLAKGRVEGSVDEIAWAAGTLVVAASTVAHGISAAPGRRLLAARLHARAEG